MMRIETAPREIHTVTREYIDMRAPQSTAADLVRTIPSMNVATSSTSGTAGGAIGAAEVRGLTDSDMTVTLNGGPALGVSYIGQIVAGEDIDMINMFPAAPSVEVPSTTSAAGILSIVTHDAAKKAGGTVDFSYGTNNMSREFIRLESGNIGNTNLRGYVSFMNVHARSWMGAGINETKNMDFGVQDDFANGSNFKLFFSYNHTAAAIDNFPTASQFYSYKQTGTGYGHSAGYDASNNNYWRDNLSYWNQFTLSAPIHVVLSRKLSFDLMPYLNGGYGPSPYIDGNAEAGQYYYANGSSVPAGQALVSFWNGTKDLTVGAVASLKYDVDAHNKLSLGYWYQNTDTVTYSPLSSVMADGESPDVNDMNHALYYANGLRATSYARAGYELHSLFVQDHAKYFHDKLTIDGGFKYVMSNYWYNYRGNSASGVSRSTLGLNSGVPLPQLAVGYMFNRHHQVYINAEGDFRQPSPSTLSVSPYTGALPKNQYVIKEVLGYRYNDSIFMADIALFNYNITNRLLTTYIAAGQSATINAGNQTSRGVDVSISTHPIHGFSPYASVEYLSATMDSNIPLEGSYIATKGHRAPMAPKVLANLGLTYTNGGFFGNFSLHYASSQSVTLAGDEHMPGYVTDTLSLGYHFKSFSYLKSPTFRMNFTNLTGSIVRTGPTGVTTNARQVRLMNGQLSDASDVSPNSYFVEPRFSMTGTLSTNF